jgi:hypothetical protein
MTHAQILRKFRLDKAQVAGSQNSTKHRLFIGRLKNNDQIRPVATPVPNWASNRRMVALDALASDFSFKEPGKKNKATTSALN